MNDRASVGSRRANTSPNPRRDCRARRHQWALAAPRLFCAAIADIVPGWEAQIVNRMSKKGKGRASGSLRLFSRFGMVSFHCRPEGPEQYNPAIS